MNIGELDFYTIHGRCTNCGETGMKQIAKGTPVKAVPCSECGCKTVERFTAPAPQGPTWQGAKELSTSLARAANRED